MELFLSPFSFAFLFATPHYNPHRLVDCFRRMFPAVKLLGCATEGIILRETLLSRGLAVLVLGGEVKSFTFNGQEHHPLLLGEQAGRAIQDASFREGTVFIFFDVSIEVPCFLQGIYNILGPHFSYLGGGTETSTWTEEGVCKGSVSVGVVEGIAFSTQVGHGWSPTQDLLVVTKTRGREAIEIDGIAPYGAYRERIGTVAQENFLHAAALHPLGFLNVFGEYLIRDPAYLTPEGSIGFVGSRVPSGAVGYIMEGTEEKLLSTVKEVTRRARQKIEKPCFALVFDCVSRSSFLGNRYKEELREIVHHLGDIPTVGFLSTGEVHPYGHAPRFHNKTVVVLVGGEGAQNASYSPLRSQLTLEAELAILHEISAFSFSGSYPEFFQETVERAVRLFGVQKVALLTSQEEQEFFASFGLSLPESMPTDPKACSEKQLLFLLGKKQELGRLFFETLKPITSRERRLYTLFARKIEDILREASYLMEKEQELRRLEYLSHTDDLTGLYNRRGFFFLAQHQLSLARRESKPSVLLYLDLDNLKWINDHFGHHMGDRALQEFSNLLRRVFRQSDLIARIGGDEFALLLLGVAGEELDEIIHRLNQAVEEWNKENEGSYHLSFSVGGALLDPSESVNLHELLHLADQEMYQKKRTKNLSM